MKSSTAFMLLPLVASAATIQNPRLHISGPHHNVGVDKGPGHGLVPGAKKPTTTKAPPAKPTTAPPTSIPSIAIMTSPNDSPEQQYRNQDAQLTRCRNANDCHDYCQKQVGQSADVKKWGLSYTCIGAQNHGETTQGACTCGSAELVAKSLLAIGDVLCVAANDAINKGIDIALTVIPYVGPEAKAAKDLFKIGEKIVKKGAKDCAIDVCPGHTYTVVDPNDIQSQAGIFAC